MRTLTFENLTLNFSYHNIEFATWRTNGVYDPDVVGVWTPDLAIDSQGVYLRDGEPWEVSQDELAAIITAAIEKGPVIPIRRDERITHFRGLKRKAPYLYAELAARELSPLAGLLSSLTKAKNLSQVKKDLGGGLVRKLRASPEEFGAWWDAHQVEQEDLFEILLLALEAGLEVATHLFSSAFADEPLEGLMESLEVFPSRGAKMNFLRDITRKKIHPKIVEEVLDLLEEDAKPKPNWVSVYSKAGALEEWIAPPIPSGWPREGWEVLPVWQASQVSSISFEMENCFASYRKQLEVGSLKAYLLTSPEGEVGLIGVQREGDLWTEGLCFREGKQNQDLKNPGFAAFHEEVMALLNA